MKIRCFIVLLLIVLLIGSGCEKNSNNELENLKEDAYGNYVVTTKPMTIGSIVPLEVDRRKTPQEAIKDWVNITNKKDETIPIYIKHSFNDNDNITASYIEFIINDDLKKEWKEDSCKDDVTCEEKYDNLVNGTYSLRGGNSDKSYEDNKNVIKKAFNFKKQPDICMDGGPDFSCDLKDLYASARGYGDVRVNSKDNGCRISSDGYSYCE